MDEPVIMIRAYLPPDAVSTDANLFVRYPDNKVIQVSLHHDGSQEEYEIGSFDPTDMKITAGTKDFYAVVDEKAAGLQLQSATVSPTEHNTTWPDTAKMLGALGKLQTLLEGMGITFPQPGASTAGGGKRKKRSRKSKKRKSKKRKSKTRRRRR